MRVFLCGLLLLGLVLGLPQTSVAQDDLKPIIAKAIKAHGGEEKLAAIEKKGLEMKSRGTIHLLGGFNFTSDTFAQLPDKFKEVVQMEINGMQITQTVVANGDKVWIKVNDMDIDLGDALTKEMKEQAHERRATSLLPLLKDKTFQLGPLGEVKVGDEETVGIKVSAKDRRDIDLYFSKKSGLLLKVASRAFDFMTMQEVDQEMVMSDYKEQNGYMTPLKLLISRDGKKFLEKETLEFRIVDKIDDSVFAKP